MLELLFILLLHLVVEICSWSLQMWSWGQNSDTIVGSALGSVRYFFWWPLLQWSLPDHQVRSESCYHCSLIVVLESNDWSHNRTWNARTASVKTSSIQVFIGYKTLIERCYEIASSGRIVSNNWKLLWVRATMGLPVVAPITYSLV